MPNINIQVRQKRAYSPQARLVCGNSDYTITFDFDPEWDEYEVKTARFIYNGQIADVVFTGAVCAVPKIINATHCAVGVFAGDLRTTTPAMITCAKSILCSGGSPVEPAPDVYAQIMELLNQGGGEGGPGGYYTPVVAQPTPGSLQMSFTPSAEGMAVVEPVTVQLPAGPVGPTGPAYELTEADKQEMVDAVLVALPDGDEVSY